jgi:uncharacterized protein YodC (DUF2158 family)
MERAAWSWGVAGVLASFGVAAGCAGDGALGTAVQREDCVGWKVVQGADFNRDGMGDLLWYDGCSNRITVWLMDGAHVLATGPEIPGPSGGGWAAITAADCNGDGMNDVIWFNDTTHRMAVWLMDGTQVLAPGPEIPGPSGDGWTIDTAIDTNLDGLADIVWYNRTTGQLAIWLMDGTRVLAPGPELPGPRTAHVTAPRAP